MRNNIKFSLVMLVAIAIAGCGIAGTASAHFTMLFPGGGTDVSPDDYLANMGEEKTVLITWGCPFKELFDCIDIPEAYVRDPDGNVTQLTPVEVSVDGVKAYTVSFTVDKRGDYIVYSTMNVTAINGDFIDHAKTVIHCGQASWNGWDAELGENVEIIPYIRPYGLEEGFVFRGRVVQNGAPLANTTVYIVKYRLSNDPTVLKKADELYPQDSWMMVKGFTKTDSDGDFVYTLDEPGVWNIAAFGKGIMERSILTLPVFEAFPPEEGQVSTSPDTGTDTTSAPAPASESPASGLFTTIGIIGLITVLLMRKRSGGVR